MVQYFVNSKRKQVVCVLNDKHTGRSFKGVAKCCEEDTFDLEFGKKLAFLRAQEKEIAANLSVMANQYDEETRQMFIHQHNASAIRNRAIGVIQRGNGISKEIENLLK